MSEKFYACVLRLVAPHFFRVYGEEATRLVGDRCCDEQGIISRIGLWFDLLTDLVVAATRDHRFARHALSQLGAAQIVKPVPSFAVIRSGSLHTAALLVGGAFSLVTLATLSALIVNGGYGQATSPSLPGILQFSAPTRSSSWRVLAEIAYTMESSGTATSMNSPINEQNHMVRAHLFGTPGVSAQLAGRSLTLADAALDANEKERVLNGVIANLREYYVYPSVALKMINALLTHQKNGDYKGEVDGADFAALLTKQLQDVSHDLHLRVIYSATEMPDRPLGPPEADPNFRSMVERTNCAFRKVEVLAHNIGYIKFDAFGPVSLCRDTAAAAMQFLAHVDALIFDLRENQGGDPHMVSFIASYLFDHRTHLNDIYTQRDKATEEFWTVNVPGSRFVDKPAYVLTSSETFSGAEEFAYDLKNLKRAVIVGEPTAGGAHPVMPHRIDAHFAIGVPFGRPINPISKTDWEGTGVVPDVKVKPTDALQVAEQFALRKLQNK